MQCLFIFAPVLRGTFPTLDSRRKANNELARNCGKFAGYRQRHAAIQSAQNSRFHKALIELSGSSVLVLFMAMLNHIFERNIPIATFSSALQGDGGKSGEETIKANEQLVGLIEQGAADVAEKFWREYHENLAVLSRERLPLDATIAMPD